MQASCPDVATTRSITRLLIPIRLCPISGEKPGAWGSFLKHEASLGRAAKQGVGQGGRVAPLRH
jgi:hypothetical protein